MTATQTPPTTAVVAATFLLALALVAVPFLWRRTRHVVTIAHEGAHGVVALLSGRRLSGIRLHSDTSGVTVSSGRPTGIGMILTAAAGYPGPAVVGLGAAALLHQGRALVVLWGSLVLLALLLLQIRNFFGLWSVVVSGAVVLLVTTMLDETAQSAFAYVIVWFLLLASPRAVVELQAARRGRGGRDSDPDQLARLTFLPAIVWVGLFLVVTVAALVGGAGLLVRPTL